MVSEVSAVKFRQNLGEMLNTVQYRNDSIIIKKDGQPVAALIDTTLFERIRAMQERFDELTDKLALGFAGMSDDEVCALVDEAVAQERAQARALARQKTA